jgi:hypothetical protein
VISATDSFISYLSANLSSNPPVAYIRATADNPNSNDLRVDTLNVSVFGFQEDGSQEMALVSLDIIASDERTVMDWAKRVRDVLIQEQHTPELDYEANPAAPITTGRHVSWDGRAVNFQVIRRSLRIVHVNATFNISHVRQ